MIATCCDCPTASVDGDGARPSDGSYDSIISEKTALPVEVESVNTLAPSGWRAEVDQ